MREWRFRGRDRELARLRELLDDRAPGVVIRGEAGLGKTRLALEGLRLAEDAGLVTMKVSAGLATAKVPFGAWAPVLATVRVEPLDSPGVRAEFIRASCAALLDRAGDRALALVVDDAHHLDDASAALVQHLAATRSAFVIATVRTGEVVPDPVTALWKDDLLERIDLAALDPAAIEQVLAATLGGPIEAATVAHLHAHTEGNALFLRELVRGALTDGSLTRPDDIWRLAGPMQPSGRLMELVDARLGALDDDERALLELVAFAEPLGPAEITALSDLGIAERLERKGLLASSTSRRRLRVRLAHPIYGDVIRTRIPAIRTRIMAQRLAEVIESLGARRREDALRVGLWRLETGGGRPEILLAAATEARWRHDLRLASDLARAATDAGAGFDAALLSAQLDSLQGDAATAETALAALSAAAEDDDQRAAVALTRLDNHTVHLGGIDDALRIARDAEDTITDPSYRDEITARRAGLLLLTDGPEAGAAVSEPLLTRARGRALVWASFIASYSLSRQGRLDAATEASALGLQANRRLPRPVVWLPMHMFDRGELLALAGRFTEADKLLDEQNDSVVTGDSPEARATLRWQQCRSVGERGHVRSAIEHGREAVTLFRELDRPHFQYFSLIPLALAHALAGQVDQARDALAELDALRTIPRMGMEVDVLQARAWTSIAAGDTRAGAALLNRAADLGEQIQDNVGAAAALHGLARIGEAAAVADRLSTLTAGIDGELAPERAAHTHNLAARDPVGLRHNAERFERMQAFLLAAEAAADAAVAWYRRDEPRKAASAQRTAAGLRRHCPGAVTPTLLAVKTRTRLTTAERDCATLAAAGHTNRELAERLNLSIRTVESHLHHTFHKLGITRRTELPDAMKER